MNISTCYKFIEKAKLIHQDKYDYSLVDYKKSRKKVTIVCPIHGEFQQTPNHHLLGQGCKICGEFTRAQKRKLNNEKFINLANKKHSNVYDYSLVQYEKSEIPIKIICKQHGEFNQSPSNHLQGQGCPSCAREINKEYHKNNAVGWSFSKWEDSGNNSKNFDSFKVYVIKCWNEKEEFFKIGKTFKEVKKRFIGKFTMPYNYKVIDVFIGTAKNISELEVKLKNKHKDLKYCPDIKFEGMYECYSNYLKN